LERNKLGNNSEILTKKKRNILSFYLKKKY